ncbi:helix-turn-helix transcriptional regulator [Natrialbaceae archaeon A-chndr2]
MNTRVGVTVLVTLFVLASIGPVAGVHGAGETDVSQPESTAFQQDQIDADEVRMDVFIHADGTAEWTLEFWVRLDDDDSEAAFESLQSDIQSDPDNYTTRMADRMADTAATASDATGREMTVDGFEVETQRQSLAREYGIVRYTFDWHGFAAVDDGTIRAGDAIEGIYLDDGTRLLFEWPEEYDLETAAPDPDDERDQVVIWRGGDTDFVSGEPRVVLTTGTGWSSMLPLVAAALVVVGGGVYGIWWYSRRDRTVDRSEVPGTDSGTQSVSDASRADTEAEPSMDHAEKPTSESEAATERSEPPNAAAVDTTLLSNEEQVIRLLEERGGRLKQQTVVEELGWTDAKTSKVVTGLRESGELESFRLGRENVLSLPESDEASGSSEDADVGVEGGEQE